MKNTAGCVFKEIIKKNAQDKYPIHFFLLLFLLEKKKKTTTTPKYVGFEKMGSQQNIQIKILCLPPDSTRAYW